MKTLTKLTLVVMTAMILGAATLMAGPNPFDRHFQPNIDPVVKVTPRALPAAAPMKCERMTVKANPRLGGTVVVACTTGG